MKLADWIAREKLSRADVAKRLAVSPPYVTMLCGDEPNWPGRDLMVRIRSLTGDEVTESDFMPSKDAADERAGVAA